MLHLYIELRDGGIQEREVAEHIDKQLDELDRNYHDLKFMAESHPLKVTLLGQGSFENYSSAKQAAGFDLAHLKPPRMNASDITIVELVKKRNVFRADM